MLASRSNCRGRFFRVAVRTAGAVCICMALLAAVAGGRLSTAQAESDAGTSWQGTVSLAGLTVSPLPPINPDGSPLPVDGPAPPLGPMPKKGRSVIWGTAVNDRIVGTSGDDLIYAYSGNDRIEAAGGNDIIFGGSGSDVIWGEAGNDHIFGGPGNDRIAGGPGRDGISCGRGRDSIVRDRRDRFAPSCRGSLRLRDMKKVR